MKSDGRKLTPPMLDFSSAISEQYLLRCHLPLPIRPRFLFSASQKIPRCCENSVPVLTLSWHEVQVVRRFHSAFASWDNQSGGTGIEDSIFKPASLSLRRYMRLLPCNLIITSGFVFGPRLATIAPRQKRKRQVSDAPICRHFLYLFRPTRQMATFPGHTVCAFAQTAWLNVTTPLSNYAKMCVFLRTRSLSLTL